MYNQHTKGNKATICGSGLLAIDVVIYRDERDAFEITAGGTCANVLSNLSYLGWDAKARGRIGRDAAGHVLTEHLRDAGVDIAAIVLADHVETPLVVERFGLGNVDEPSHRFEWNCPICLSPVPRFRATPIAMLETMHDESDVPNIFFFDRPTPSNLRVAKDLKDYGTTIMFEPPRMQFKNEYQQAVNVADIIKLADINPESYPNEWINPQSLIIITNGSKGLSYRANNFSGIVSDWVSLPALNLTRVLDSCGSGDWLTAGMLHSFFAVKDLTEDIHGRLIAALKYGQVLASLNCLLPGARGLSRVFNHAEISDMVAVILANGLPAIETRVTNRSKKVGMLRDIRTVCNSCRKAEIGLRL